MTAYKDLYSDLKVDLSLKAQVVTADQNGTSVDLQDYDSCMFVANVGASGDTLSGSVKIELELEESDDNSSFTDVANTDLQKYVTGTNAGTFAVIDSPSEDDAVYITGYKGNKRYVRPVVNVTGTHTNGTPIAITALRGHAHAKPVNV